MAYKSFVDGWVRKRIRRNKNLIAMFEGETGSGKSWAALSWAEALDPDFCVDRVVFSGYDFLKLLKEDKNLKSGSVILYDEAGVGAGHMEYQQRDIISFNYVLQTFREKNYIILFTAPDTEMIVKTARNLSHLRIDMYDIKESEGCSFGYVYRKAKNRKTGKIYWKNIRLNDGTYVRAKRFFKPSDKLRIAYLDEKERYMNRIIDMALTKAKEKDAFSELTDLQNTCYDLYVKDDLTMQKTADKLGITIQAVSTHLKACRKKGYPTTKKTKPPNNSKGMNVYKESIKVIDGRSVTK